jgi:hypothetical protein
MQMTEEGNEIVEEGIIEATEAVQEHDDDSQETQGASDQKRNDEEKNWAEVRRKMKDQQHLIEESQRRIAELTTPKSSKQEDEWGIEDEDLVEGKHLKELKKELKSLKSELRNRENDSVQDRVRARFTDFQDVVTPENIELLKEKKPVLAKALSRTDNQYELAVEAYDLIKTYVLKEAPKESLEARRAAENASKPRSVQAMSKTSAMADLNQFAEMSAKGKKEFLRSKHEEMQNAIRAG